MIKTSEEILNDIVEVAAHKFERLYAVVDDPEDLSYLDVAEDMVKTHEDLFFTLICRLMAERDW